MWTDNDLYDEYLRGQIDVMEVLAQAIKERYIENALDGTNPSAMVLNATLKDLYQQVSKTLKLS